MNKPTINISVKDLIEYNLRSGDINTGFFKRSRPLAGIKGHQIVQKMRGSDYKKEFSIEFSQVRDECVLFVSGRIDGLFHEDGIIVIEEIKTTIKPLKKIEENHNPLHWGQAKCYAYIYGKQQKLSEIKVRLTYYQIDTEQMKTFDHLYSMKELAIFFSDMTRDFVSWAMLIYDWKIMRDQSIDQLHFPFEEYRDGQKKLMSVSDDILKKGKILFCQAPTGIGKTIATLFPTIKSLEQGFSSKIFYLTAKTTTKNIAEKTFNLMNQNGLRLKYLTITAKEKICFKEEANCEPDYCEYARGHFDRVKKAIEAIFKQDSFTPRNIVQYAKEYQVCPFEFSLDLANWADAIICDYNYAFDPRVYLRRFFAEGGGNYTFLVDEAHNLVDRAREMFSAQLYKRAILDLKRETKKVNPQLSTVLHKLNSFMINARKHCEKNEDGVHFQQELPHQSFFKNLKKFSALAEEWLALNREQNFREQLLDLYFEVRNFLRTSQDYDERFVTYYEIMSRGDVKIKLFCLDPSSLLGDVLKRGRAAIFFSATLTPLGYFVNLLGGTKHSARLQLPSPFPERNLLLLLTDTISTKYTHRKYSYNKIASFIKMLVESKVGNYIVYFPSYNYMNNVLQNFKKQGNNLEIVVQNQGMTENERISYLANFKEYGQKTLVGFAVMGGIFGEGIDLIGERLSGAIIVGVGLPKLCFERELIRQYFDDLLGQGFHYSYTFPGMNKVLQAAGRVIRTQEDKGVVLLMGQRFSNDVYRALIPSHWKAIERISDEEMLKSKLESFWKNVSKRK